MRVALERTGVGQSSKNCAFQWLPAIAFKGPFKCFDVTSSA